MSARRGNEPARENTFRKAAYAISRLLSTMHSARVFQMQYYPSFMYESKQLIFPHGKSLPITQFWFNEHHKAQRTAHIQ